MNIVNFFAGTDIVIVGQDPECADFDNPRGHLYGFSAYVYAEDAAGNRRRLHIATDRNERAAMERASRQAVALNTRLARGLAPVAFSTWEAAFPAYGSAAYSEADTIEWERSLEEHV